MHEQDIISGATEAELDILARHGNSPEIRALARQRQDQIAMSQSRDAQQTQSIAEFFVELRKTRDRINHKLLPLAGHWRCEDQDLFCALETAAARIDEHLNAFRLVTEPVRPTSQEALP